jgi:hypothetical protein
MKNILLFFLFFYATSSVAQLLDYPVTLNSNGIQPPMSIFNRLVPISNPTDKYVFNVKFHIVKENDGSGVTAAYGENEVMNAIMIMNTNFNQFNIFFKYVGYDVIPNTTYMKVRAANFPNSNLSHPTFAQLLDYSKTGMTNPVYDYEAMNLFIVEGLDYNTLSPYEPRVAGAAPMPGIDSIYGYNYFLSPVLPHEIAHNFFLLHTHEQSGTPNCERVANFGDLLYNSDTNGDRVEDTKASFMFGGNYANPVTCIFQNTNNPVLDCIGTPYVNMPVRNYMSSMNSCQNLQANYLPGTGEFTPGQGNVMRNTIALYYNHPNNFYGMSNAKNTVESLYEPFVITPSSYIGPTTVTDKNPGDGMATVCRTYSEPTYRFQKGFTYQWYYVMDYLTNTFEWYEGEALLNQPNLGLTFQIGMKIPQINEDIVIIGPACTKGANIGIVCHEEPYAGGKVSSSRNLISTQYEEIILNGAQISDPALIENLESGKYHIITKEIQSGEQTQKTIYKP